jgi:hypothetical protein
MQSITLAIGILGSILVLLLRPVYALAAYVTLLVWYPEYLRITIGTIDISVGRIVVAVLLLRCLCNNRIRERFVWSALDTLVAISMLVYVGMYSLTRPFGMALENRGGFVMDTWFTYIVARMIVTDKASLISFVKVTAVVLAALAILGVSESISGRYYFLDLKRFRPWHILDRESYDVQGRWGFGRANGPFSHSIMFGSCFVMFLPLIWTLRHQRNNWGKLAYPLSGIAILGAFSSMSSGPWGMLLVVLVCLVLERYKRWTKPLLIAIIGSCIVIGIISNRPFYHVLYNYIDFTGGSWWQRARLVDLAIENFGEWWQAGYGGSDPGWGQKIGELHTDCNNEFILAGIEYGLLGVIALCSVLVAAFYALVRAFKKTTDKELRSLYWSLGSSLVGVIVVWQGVSFFGQMPALFYCILGIVAASSLFPKCEQYSSPNHVLTNNYSVLSQRT